MEEKSLKQRRQKEIHRGEFSTSAQREDDVFDEGEDSVVLDVARLTESLLQLLLHVSRRVQQIDL